MIIKISPSFLHGELKVPSSKSASQRALALSLLHKGTVRISNTGTSEDELAAMGIIKEMGAEIYKKEDGSILVNSTFGNKSFRAINCGESGLGLRMFTPICALSSSSTLINGRGSLLKRPIDFFEKILPQLGVSIESTEGKLPVTIQGPLIPADITLDGSLSSQFLTGLLIAFSYSATRPVTITVENLASRPYIDLTLKMLGDFGFTVKNHNYEKFEIYPVSNPAIDIKYSVEADWSSASFLLAGAAINGNIKLKGLDMNSTQADKAILTALSSAGISLSITDDEIEVSRSPVKPFHFDARHCPDLFPPLVALASYARGKSVIEGIGRLIHKESNRAESLKEEFNKLGVKIILQDDLMIIEGGDVCASRELKSHHDHRIAMALSIAALGADGDCLISDAEAIAKSYPGFYNDIENCGATIKKMDTGI